MTRILRAVRAVISELYKPYSGNDGTPEGGYRRGIIGIAHAVVGALLSSAWSLVFGVPMVVAQQILLVVFYWLIKETRDIRNGGSTYDSIEDSLFVAVGTSYVGPVIWPLTVLMIGFAAMVRSAHR